MMQSVLAWLKSNVLIVVLVVLTLALPPAGIIVASMWNANIRTSIEEAYKTEERSLTGAARVTYAIPSIAEGDEGWNESVAPNRAITEYVAAERERRQAEIERALESAVRLNKGDSRDVLVRGLFPGVDDRREEARLINEMVDRISGGANPSSSVYARLFDRIGAGTPPDELSVARRVADVSTTARDSGALEGADRAAAEARLRDSLVGVRVGAYRARADEINVYGSPAALGASVDQPSSCRGTGASQGGGSLSSTPISGLTAGARPTVADAYLWQWDYWIVEDLLEAVRLANTSPDGLMAQVPSATVKRIESIRIDPLGKLDPNAGNASRYGGNQGRGTNSRGPSGFGGEDDVSEAYAIEALSAPVGYTGRVSSAENQTYDVRTARMSVIVSSARIQRLLDAIASVNFMTVTGVSLSEVDLAAHLGEGYYYGEEHVIRAELQIETIWLRFWTVPNAMPEPLRVALGVTQTFEEEEQPEPSEEAQP